MKTEAIINATSRKHEAEVRTSVAKILRERNMSNSEIAKVLGVSYATVWKYLGKQPSRNYGGCYTKPKNQRKPELEKKTKPSRKGDSQKVVPLTIEARLDATNTKLERLVEVMEAFIAAVQAEPEIMDIIGK